LYSYFTPHIIFYTVPLSFISALATTLSKLSQENELIALYALGIKAKSVLRRFFLLAFLFTLLLFAISFFAMPITEQLYQSFKVDKQTGAKLNIRPGELGQKFGNYYIYVADTKDNIYKDVVIYNKTDTNAEQFFASQTGKINKAKNTNSLELDDGYGYTYSENKLQEIRYKVLEAFDTSKIKHYQLTNVLEYWMAAKNNEERMHALVFFAFINLIPLLSVLLVAAFTMINPRYQHNHSFLVTFLVTLLLYLIGSSLQRSGNIVMLVTASIALFIVGRWLFKKRVERYF
jgi:lipopolysaccharide export system permease protein